VRSRSSSGNGTTSRTPTTRARRNTYASRHVESSAGTVERTEITKKQRHPEESIAGDAGRRRGDGRARRRSRNTVSGREKKKILASNEENFCVERRKSWEPKLPRGAPRAGNVHLWRRTHPPSPARALAQSSGSVERTEHMGNQWDPDERRFNRRSRGQLPATPKKFWVWSKRWGSLSPMYGKVSRDGRKSAERVDFVFTGFS
jgi:hypothetical protein